MKIYINDINKEDEMYDGTVSEDYLMKFSKKFLFFDEETPTESQNGNNRVKLILSLWLFFSYWQYTFNIRFGALKLAL